MTLRTTTSPNGRRRYYIDGKRVTRSALEEAKFWRRLSCFVTTTRRGYVRAECLAQ